MLQLRDIMTADVHTLAPYTTLREALELFSLRHISGAPVVDGGRVIGVLSASDVMAFVASPDPAPSLVDPETDDRWADSPDWEDEEPSARYFTELWTQSASGGSIEQELAPRSTDVFAEHTVEEAMTRRVLALPPHVDVSVAADRMRTADVHRVLVMQDGVLLGLVTTMDLARAVADRRIVNRTWVFGRAREWAET